jgi:hypothetical protein
MKDRSIKYSEEYIRVIVEDLRRDFQTRVSGLQQHHEEALRKWKQDSAISSALQAAYHEELEQLKTDFTIKLKEVQEDVNSLVDVNSQRIKQHLLLLQSKIHDLFRFINQSAVMLASLLFLRSENFFE